MPKQRNEMKKIHKVKREKARAQIKAFAGGKLPGEKLNRLARKILRKTNVVAAAKKAAAAGRGHAPAAPTA